MSVHYRFLYVVLICLVFLSGCGRQNASVSTSTGANTLRVAVVGASAQELEDQKAVNDVIRRNMKANNIKIETYRYPISAISQSKIELILAELASDSSPDVIFLSSLADSKLLDDYDAITKLDGIIKTKLPGFDDLVYKSAVLSVYWGGHYIGIPRTIEPIMIIYNKKHFKEAKVQPDPNWSWADYTTISEKILSARADKIANDKLYISAATRNENRGAGFVSGDPYCWLPFILSNGGYYINDSKDIGIQSAASIETLKWFHGQTQRGNLVNIKVPRLALAAEIVSFGPERLSSLSFLNAKNDTFAALPVPKSPRTGQSVTSVVGSVYVINAKAKNMDLAVDFVVASLSSQAQKRVVSLTSQLSVRKDVPFPPWPWLPTRAVLASVLENAIPLPQPFISGRPIWVLSQYWNSLISGDRTPEQVAKATAEDLREVIALKNTPAAPKPAESFLGQAYTPPKQKPPAIGFKGVTVHWVTNENCAISMVDAFNEKNKDTYISITLLNDFKDGDLDQRSLADGSADIVDLPVNLSDIKSLVVKGSLASLDRYLQMEPAYIQSGIANNIKYAGKTYAVPLQRLPLMIFADKDVWKQIGKPYPTTGWRWEDFLAWIDKSAAIGATKHGVLTQSSIWSIAYEQQGGQWAAYSLTKLESAIKLMEQVWASYPADRLYVDKRPRPSVLDVTYGTAAACIGFPSQVRTLDQDKMSSLDQKKLIALPFPTFNKQQIGTGYVTSFVALSTKAPHPNEAVQFIMWMISNEGSRAYANAVRDEFPAIIYAENYKQYRNFWGSQVEAVFPSLFDVIDGHSSIVKAGGDIVEKYLGGNLSLSNATKAIASQF